MDQTRQVARHASGRRRRLVKDANVAANHAADRIEDGLQNGRSRCHGGGDAAGGLDSGDAPIGVSPEEWRLLHLTKAQLEAEADVSKQLAASTGTGAGTTLAQQFKALESGRQVDDELEAMKAGMKQLPSKVDDELEARKAQIDAEKKD